MSEISIYIDSLFTFFSSFFKNELMQDPLVHSTIALTILALLKLYYFRKSREIFERKIKILENEIDSLNSQLNKRNSVLQIPYLKIPTEKILAKKDIESEIIKDIPKVTQLSVDDKLEVEKYISSDISDRYSDGLQKTRSNIFSKFKSLFSTKNKTIEELIPALEEILLSSDLGVSTTTLLLDDLKNNAKLLTEISEKSLKELLKQSMIELLNTQSANPIEAKKVDGKPKVIVVVGINGVGKTTTIGKLSHMFVRQGASVLLGGCDTFRAAAYEQLKEWGSRSGVSVVTGKENAKPTTVAFETIHEGLDGKVDIIILDTAGRLHTKVNLMNELEHVFKIIAREHPGSPHETILVLDASTGQNGLVQAKEFNQAVPLTGVIVTKLDGTPKGGIVFSIVNDLKVPIRYIGVGEGLDDLKPFDANAFVNALFNEESLVSDDSETVVVSAHAEVRRRKKRASE